MKTISLNITITNDDEHLYAETTFNGSKVVLGSFKMLKDHSLKENMMAFDEEMEKTFLECKDCPTLIPEEEHYCPDCLLNYNASHLLQVLADYKAMDMD